MIRVRALAERLMRPAGPRRLLFLDLGRLGVFLLGVLAVTGALLSLHYRPAPEAAYESVVTVTHEVRFGWLVRGVHRIAGHAMVAVAAVYVLRGFFRRHFLKPRGALAWPIAVGFALVSLAFLVTGEMLPWNAEAYWQVTVTSNLVQEIPLIGRWSADFVRGGTQVSGATLVRLHALHVVLLPWIAFALLVAARDLRRRGDLS